MTLLDRPLVLAPMAGGPSTVALAAAVAGAGGFPFLAGAYLTPERLAADIADLRASTTAFGVNVFAPSPDSPDRRSAAEAYAVELAPWTAAAGVELGEPRWDDDHFAAKVDLLVELAPPLVSFAFGWPPAEVVERLQDRGIEVWVTLNDPAEVEWAHALGVDGMVAQGWQAGGHRGGPTDTGAEQLGAVDLLRAVRARTSLPVIAAGGVAGPDDVRALLGAGATAVASGTAYLRSDEAGTTPVHRHALATRKGTTVTRAFTGRSARALATSWTDRFGEAAPAAYPHVHHVTAPLRNHGKATGQPDLVHLWAGTGHASARTGPAADITRDLVEGAR